MDERGKYVPVIAAMHGLVEELLALMQRALRGDAVDEALYLRAFGAKEGMLPQLQKICGLVEEMAALEKECAPQVQTEDVGMYEKQLIAHYLQEYRARTAPSEDDGS